MNNKRKTDENQRKHKKPTQRQMKSKEKHMKIKENLMNTSENPGKIRKTHWKANKLKKHEWTIKTIKGKPKEIVEKQMKTS